MTIASLAIARAHQLAEIVAKYDGRAPRYTSYPTAVQFTPQVDEAAYRDWLSALPTDDPVSVYLHIPFCHRLCWYCGCNTRATTRHEPVGEYVELLLAEARLLQKALPGRLRASSVHLGGGSPNMLSPAELGAIFRTLDQVFEPTQDREVAAELDPADLTREWVAAAASHGLNRASLGVQTLDPAVQAAVNRVQSYEQVAACVAWLREFGVRSLNIDLMYGLPHQTTANVLQTVDAVMGLRPERLALFGYAHVPWMKAHQQLIDEGALPWPAQRLEQSEAAAERLVSEGYVRVGLDHFALPDDEMAQAMAKGRLHRNFQGYTTDAAGTLLGLGASSIGRVPQGFVQNVAQELGWRTAVREGRLPVARGVALSHDDRFRREIIERLMCDLTVDLADVCARHDRNVGDLAADLQSLAPFCADGLVEIDGDRVRVIGPGRLVVRSICAAFDRYFDDGAGRHAKAL